MTRFALIPALLLLCTSMATAADLPTLRSDDLTLTFVEKNGGYTLRLTDGTTNYVPQDGCAATLEVFAANSDASTVYAALYDGLDTGTEGTVVATATLTTAGGSEIRFTDTWSVQADRQALRLQRSVKVAKAGATDASFNSYFILGDERQRPVSAYQYFLPSLVYVNGENMTDASIGHDFGDQWILAREERTALPLTMMRHTTTGATLTLCDDNKSMATDAVDWGMDHLVSSAFRYGSIGYCLTRSYPQLCYCYPGSEGEHSYSDGGGTADRRWARRSGAGGLLHRHLHVCVQHPRSA